MSYDPGAQVSVLREELDALEETAQELDAVMQLPDKMRANVEESLRTLRGVADDAEYGATIDPDEVQRLLYKAIVEVREERENLEMVTRRMRS